jgi:hypothetical protein
MDLGSDENSNYIISAQDRSAMSSTKVSLC